MMPTEKPNVLLILADDIGWFDISAYHRGIMGGQTPNIDRIAAEGALLTDNDAQASCTAGRAAFITGQLPMRTGLTTVGMPGAKQGIRPEDPTLAELLKPQGYMTAQHSKNHLGDRNEFLPTVHGFDEFYGNLYHLNAEEEPEQPDYPRDNPIVQRLFLPRGVLDCRATEVDDPTEDERFGRVGKQTITDTGPLTRKRMETIEDDLLARSLNFIDRAHQANRPFLLWHNTTRMHVWTRLSDRWRDKTGLGRYADGMQELDWVVGELLAKLEELGIADNTIVVFATDNGAEKFFYYGEHDLFAIRYNNWKVHLQIKDDWFGGALLRPTVPRPVNLRVDPLEQHMDAPAYPIYAGEKLWTVLPAAAMSSSTQPPSRTSHHARHHPTSTPKEWSKRWCRPPRNAKETSEARTTRGDG